jgi:hypothetical protein
MAIRPAGIAVATPPAPTSSLSQNTDNGPVSQKRDYTPEEMKVRGQVRMHGIIAGYKVAGQLASTLATTAAEIRGELHKLAQEVAEKIEAYSFMENK